MQFGSDFNHPHPRLSPLFLKTASRQSLLQELSMVVGQGCRKSVICPFNHPSELSLSGTPVPPPRVAPMAIQGNPSNKR